MEKTATPEMKKILIFMFKIEIGVLELYSYLF